MKTLTKWLVVLAGITFLALILIIIAGIAIEISPYWPFVLGSIAIGAIFLRSIILGNKRNLVFYLRNGSFLAFLAYMVQEGIAGSGTNWPFVFLATGFGALLVELTKIRRVHLKSKKEPN